MPPLRLAIVLDVAANPDSATREVRQRLNKPRATVDRQLQALHMLDVLDCDEYEDSHRAARHHLALSTRGWHRPQTHSIQCQKCWSIPLDPKKEGLRADESSSTSNISGTEIRRREDGP
jgi:hypothetical protein